MNLLSVKEYADGLRVSRAAIHSRRANGTIEFIKRDGVYYIDVDKFPLLAGRAGRPSAASRLKRGKKYPSRIVPQ